MEEAYKQKLENARVGYQAAMSHSSHESQMMWARCNAMLIANGIIVASIGWLLPELLKTDYNIVLHILLFLLSLFGLILCYLWICVTERTALLSVYWTWCARELEEKYLSQPVSTLARGGKLAGDKKSGVEPEPVTIYTPTAVKKLEPNWVVRSRRIKTVPRWICALFVCFYFVCVVFGIASFWWKRPYSKDSQTSRASVASIEQSIKDQGASIRELHNEHDRISKQTDHVADVQDLVIRIEGIVQGLKQGQEDTLKHLNQLADQIEKLQTIPNQKTKSREGQTER